MRRSLLAVLALLFAMPLAAFNRGEVYFEHSSSLPWSSSTYYEPWVFDARWDYAFGAGASPLLYKEVPMFGQGHFFIRASNEIVFHDRGTVSVWDGVPHIFSEPGKGYTEIFHDDAELGEIAPMRSGGGGGTPPIR
jgi:hypothetical protein